MGYSSWRDLPGRALHPGPPAASDPRRPCPGSTWPVTFRVSSRGAGLSPPGRPPSTAGLRASASPVRPGDAIPAQAAFDCSLAADMTATVRAGRVTGPVRDLALDSYNAGEGMVLATGGDVSRYPAETQGYLTRIAALAAGYTAAPRLPPAAASGRQPSGMPALSLGFRTPGAGAA